MKLITASMSIGKTIISLVVMDDLHMKLANYFLNPRAFRRPFFANLFAIHSPNGADAV